MAPGIEKNANQRPSIDVVYIRVVGWFKPKDALSLGMYRCFLQVASDDGAFDRLDGTIDSSTRTPTTFRTGSSDTLWTLGLLMTKVMGFHFNFFCVFLFPRSFAMVFR